MFAQLGGMLCLLLLPLVVNFAESSGCQVSVYSIVVQ